MLSGPLATIILAGGKGTRMGSSDRHKVCFEVLGVPVIIRALETYNLCGSALNIVVVGMMAESVMNVASRRFPGTAYAFQDQPLGTGDAARKGAEILERARFEGDVLVVAGDKVIEPGAIRRLLAFHRRCKADVTLATAKRPPDSSAGILLSSTQGNVLAILEEVERQRLAALALLNDQFRRVPVLSRSTVQSLLAACCTQRLLRRLEGEIWDGSADEDQLRRQDFQHRFSADQRRGILRVGRETVPAHRILERFDQMNLSTYLFRAAVLYEALSRLKPDRPGHEEYLTDVFGILARDKTGVRMLGCEIERPRDVMAFNNPQELLAIEEVYRQKEGATRLEVIEERRQGLAATNTWSAMIENPSASMRRQLRQYYGEDVPWRQFQSVLRAFASRHGAQRPVAIFRSPGRINLMGRHIDHQGGTVNVMAVNREILLVAAPRSDDTVSLANTQPAQFSEQTFRISELIANLNWDDWQRVIDGPRIQRLLEGARGDWANYIKAAILRLQDQFRDRQLPGLDMVVGGDIPMGAGLSSSSALVVATAEAVRAFNRLPVSARRLVSLCGEGEWFVGTRGGAADHAAIKLARRGCVTRVGFFPFEIEDSAPFFAGHDLVACNSGLYAGKSSAARNTFNAKVTAYHIGRVWFKMLRPDLASSIEHLRDINPERLGLPMPAFLQVLSQLPQRITRAQVQAAFGQVAEAERQRLERMFLSHDAPPAGYAVRGVVLFGLAEMARARKCLDFLKQGDAAGLGRLMTTSHDGDRVSRQTAGNRWQRLSRKDAGRAQAGLTAVGPELSDLADVPGAYGCSLPELDRIVDIARAVPGVEGAQLAGAGLGGCIMVLVRKPMTQDLLEALARQEIRGEVFRPIAGACGIIPG
jgi:N-acetylgalactosamine kinase